MTRGSRSHPDAASDQPTSLHAVRTASGTATAKGDTTAIGQVVSSTPGRTRIRVDDRLRTPAAMADIQQQLSQHESVQDVSVNPRTGSVVVTHDTGHHGAAIVHEALGDAESLGSSVLDLPEGGEYSELDQRLADMTYQVRKWIYERTGIRTGSGYLLPIGIAGVGVLQIMLVGITIEMLPGPVLLYIAWDIYKRGRKEAPLGAIPA